LIPSKRFRSCIALATCWSILAGCAAQSESERSGDVAQEESYREPSLRPSAPRENAKGSYGTGNGAARRNMDLGAGKIEGYLDNPQAVYILQDEGGSGATVANPEAKPASAKPTKREARLMILTGAVRLASPEVDSVLDRAEAMAARLGGYTDRRDQRSVVVRVPVEKYDEAFRIAKTLGRMLSHETRAQDVTDEFTDVVLQIRIKRMYLEKLQAILAKEKELDRRKPLIQEIQTLTESIELLERRQAGLKRDAAFSTLTISCEPVQRRSIGAGPTDDLAVFRWIHQLQARSTDDRSPGGDRLSLPVPSGMVELPLRDSKIEWMSASPEGCEFRARKLDNQPVGDANFWQEAIRLRLAGGFRTADTASVGTWKVLRLQSGDPGAWGWLLAVRIREDKLQLAQGFCPDSGLDRRMRPAFEKALREVAP